jgi:uncharacterized protein (DUF1810 family)
MKTSYQLERFVEAQDANGTFQAALEELRTGHKTSHWMWFVFPQVAGLGRSPMSQEYAISSIAEAKAYLEHPVLGTRLTRCASALASTPERSAEEIFGALDAQKLQSSMTLFARADPECEVFAQVLGLYFDGAEDAATIQRL